MYRDGRSAASSNLNKEAALPLLCLGDNTTNNFVDGR
jgi:hypothetical protein